MNLIKRLFRPFSKRKTKSIRAAKINKNNEDIENDSNKRAFLKLAGLIGLGVAASSLLPKKAEALVFGSSPAASHVGVKDLSNSPINPATEGTLQNVDENIALVKTATDAIKTNSDKFFFDANHNLLTSSTAADAENIGKSVNDQSIWMLHKIITLLKPLGMTTGSNSNRLSIDVNSGSVSVSSGTITTVTTVGTVSSMTNLVNIGNVNSFSLMKDSAKNAYANSIRSKISF